MGFYFYIAGALTLLVMGAEALVRTVRVEVAEFRRVLHDPEPHGGKTRIRKIFPGRLGVALMEPIGVLCLGGMTLLAGLDENLETARLMLPLVLLVWLQFRMFRFNIMPPFAIVAMVLFLIGQFTWPDPSDDLMVLPFPTEDTGLD